MRQNVGISSTERPVYRESYSSRGSGYIEDSSRTVSRVPHRGSSHLYDEDDDGGRYMYVEHPSRYNDGGSRNFSSTSGVKRPYSSIVSQLLIFFLFLIVDNFNPFTYGLIWVIYDP